MFHSEKLPSAIERYEKEIVRVVGVLDSVLAKQPFLLGDKLTVADIAFVPWNNFALAGLVPAEIDLKAKYPAFAAWHGKLLELDYVKSGIAEKEALSKH
ncbi:hypothetical protein RQP46_008877 [Phenoliferia psychrophenolica]